MRGSSLFDGKFEPVFGTRFSRRGFLRFLGVFLGALLVPGKKGRRAFAALGTKLEPRQRRQAATLCDVAAVQGEDPALITRKAVEALGGIEKFVKRGDVVVIKPNIGWDRTPEQAGNTNPAVVAELVTMCRDAGAKMVRVFDRTCADERRTYESSGIAEAARRAGAVVYYANHWKFYPARFPAGSLMEDWPLFRDAVECDCFINVPVAKHHGLARLTLSMKNLMGVCGGSRGDMHRDIDRKLVEVTAFIKPDLNVIDAYRILVRHGPTGGNLEDVEKKSTVIAGADPVLADAYACRLFNVQPAELGYLRFAAKAGLGTIDVKKARIKEIKI